MYSTYLLFRTFTKRYDEVSRHLCEVCGEETELLRLHVFTRHAHELNQVPRQNKWIGFPSKKRFLFNQTNV